MFYEILKAKYSFVTNYFEEILNKTKKKLPNSIIFHGIDTLGQYYLSINIAKILNCKESKLHICNCQNCNWINKNIHPGLINVSKLNFKPQNDTSKTVISTKQSELLKNNITLETKDYYQVVIFHDAEIIKPNNSQKKHIDSFKSIPYKIGQGLDLKEDEFYYPSGLTRKVFPKHTSNSLLKLIEEPPKNVLFIFLANNKSDIIETIVSRSICLNVNSNMSLNYSLDYINLFNGETDTYKFIKDFREIKEKNNDTLNTALDSCIFALKEALVNNINNNINSYKIKKMIQIINESKNMEKYYIKENVILENIVLNINCIK